MSWSAAEPHSASFTTFASLQRLAVTVLVLIRIVVKQIRVGAGRIGKVITLPSSVTQRPQRDCSPIRVGCLQSRNEWLQEIDGRM